MKQFAITPHPISLNGLMRRLPRLSQNKVSHLYIRSSGLHKSLETLIPAVNHAGILPVIPFSIHYHCKDFPFGIHLKGHETGRLIEAKDRSPACVSVSCHDVKTAERLLESGADFVFISPVFKPLSKPEDNRQTIGRDLLKKLVDRFAERMVLLGGMTKERIGELASDFKNDFSVAGISMFFENEKMP